MSCELPLVNVCVRPPRLTQEEQIAAHQGGVEEERKRQELRRATLAKCYDDDDNAELRQKYKREDEKDLAYAKRARSATMRFIACICDHDEYTFNDDALRENSRCALPCPGCQQDLFVSWWKEYENPYAESAALAPDVTEPTLALSIDFRCAGRDSVRAACERCDADQLGRAIAGEIMRREDREVRREQAAYAKAIAAELAPQADETFATEYLHPLVPRSALSLLVGLSGDGKTLALTGIALAIAAGRPLLGSPTTRGRVLLIVLESRNINLARLDAIGRGLGIDNVKELRESGWLDVWPAGRQLKIHDPASMAQLAAYCKLKQYAFIGIDNVTELRNLGHQNAENSADVMGAALKPFAELAQEGVIAGVKVTDNPPAVMILHHAGYDGSSRGSSGIQQHADAVIELRAKDQQAPEGIRTLRAGDGSRLIPSSLPMSIRYLGKVGSADTLTIERVDPETKRAVPAAADPKLVAAVAYLRENPGASQNKLCEQLNVSKRDIGARLDAWATEGKLEILEGKWYAVQIPVE